MTGVRLRKWKCVAHIWNRNKITITLLLPPVHKDLEHFHSFALSCYSAAKMGIVYEIRFLKAQVLSDGEDKCDQLQGLVQKYELMAKGYCKTYSTDSARHSITADNLSSLALAVSKLFLVCLD